MTTSLKQKAITGVGWSAIQRVGTMSVSFTANLVLARLLLPEDFGYVGMLMVFIAVSETFIDCGFRSALIQKQGPTRTDYSTILYVNVMIALALYVTLFFGAPCIASFYKVEHLSSMLRVLGILIVVYAVGLVQSTQLQKNLQFHKLAAIELFSAVFSAGIGIVLALRGFGVWSLIVRTLLNATFCTFLYWISSRWVPARVVSLISLRQLFSFGGLIFLSNLAETISLQLVALVIGRVYSSKDLGFYAQAKNMFAVPERTIPFATNRVLLPIFSSIQDNLSRIVNATKKSLKSLTYLNFPLMMLSAVIAKPLIVILFTEKWLPAIPYFQILCFGGMLYCVNSCNMVVLQAIGVGKTILYISLLKRGITLLSVIVGIRFGVYGIVLGSVLSIYIWFLINANAVGRLTGYGVFRQIRDIGHTYAISVLIAFVVYLGSTLLPIESLLLLLLVQVSSYLFLYLLSSYLRSDETWNSYLTIATELVERTLEKVRRK